MSEQPWQAALRRWQHELLAYPEPLCRCEHTVDEMRTVDQVWRSAWRDLEDQFGTMPEFRERHYWLLLRQARRAMLNKKLERPTRMRGQRDQVAITAWLIQQERALYVERSNDRV